MAKFEIVDAPPARTGSLKAGLHDEIAAFLKANPGQWARVMKGVKSAAAASTINTAGASAYQPRGDFEATSRQTAKGQYDVYAKYVGKPEAAPKAGQA